MTVFFFFNTLTRILYFTDRIMCPWAEGEGLISQRESMFGFGFSSFQLLSAPRDTADRTNKPTKINFKTNKELDIRGNGGGAVLD